ncbi:unnamed protein product [Calypogeia fissa]
MLKTEFGDHEGVRPVRRLFVRFEQFNNDYIYWLMDSRAQKIVISGRGPIGYVPPLFGIVSRRLWLEILNNERRRMERKAAYKKLIPDSPQAEVKSEDIFYYRQRKEGIIVKLKKG